MLVTPRFVSVCVPALCWVLVCLVLVHLVSVATLLVLVLVLVLVSGVCASCVARFGREPSPFHDSPKPLASGCGAWLKEFPKEFGPRAICWRQQNQIGPIARGGVSDFYFKTWMFLCHFSGQDSVTEWLR